MSSLRLALKQSLEESLPGQGGRPSNKRRKQSSSSSAPPTRTEDSPSTTTGRRPRGRPPKRKSGEPPRKRGRPRKHPLPQPETEETHEEEKEKAAATAKHHHHHHDEAEDDASSSEAEFSVSQEDSEHSEEEEQDEKEHQHYSSEDEAEKRRKEHKRHRKAMKAHSAANKIQNHWKKRRPSADETNRSSISAAAAAAAAATEVESKRDEPPPPPSQPKQDTEPSKKPESSSSSTKAKTVPPPDPELVAYMRGLSVKKQKRNVAAGLRVKVRFATKVRKRDGKVATKLKWYGGLVTKVSTGGSKIRIKYDDGTSEVSKFPDKDVIVDDTGNGEHRVSAGRFIPPAQRVASVSAAARPESHEQNVTEKKRPTSPKKLIRPPAKEESKIENETTDAPPSPEKKRLPQPVPSPKKEKAEDRVAASPERQEPPVVAPEEAPSESVHDESDEKMDESSGVACANETVEDTQKTTSSGDRKKPTLKIRLKGPRASIVASTSHDKVGGKTQSSSEGNVRGDDSSCGDDDVMSVEEATTPRQSPHEKDTAQQGKDGEGESVVKSPRLASESVDEDSQSWESNLARKKRSYDQVTSGGDVSEEPPKKKRAEDAPKVDTEESKNDVVDQTESGNTENTGAVEEGPLDDERKSETAVDVAEVPQARKRKRDDESTSHESPHKEAKLHAFEPVDSKTNSTDAGEPEKRAKDDAMILGSESSPTGGEAIATESGESTVVSKESVPVEAVAASENVTEREARSETPPPVAQETAMTADGSSSKGDGTAATSIPRFGRRAAQQANERIAARKEIIIEDEFAKKKKQRKDKADLKLFSAGEGKGKSKDDESGDDDDGVWVQCDDCSKWRLLPSSVQSDELPKHWYCKMNIYDPDRNSCDAPEQTMQEIAKEKRRRKKRLAKIARLEAAGKIDAETAAAQRKALDEKEMKSARSKERRAIRSPGPSKTPQDEDVEREVDKTPVPRSKRRSPTLNVDAAESPPAETPSDSQKTRPYKKQSSMESASRKSKSDAEDGDKVDADVDVESVPKKRGRGRPPRSRAQKDVNNKESDKGKSAKGEIADPDNQEWVQCELCQKWRRLPPQISADSLPETWYCSMNTWDSRVANCEAPEDKADPSHQEFGIYGSGVSTASHGNKLSYRNLIFGTGRKQNRIITERTRAAESLFLAPVDPSSDSICYPKVMYANSSVFMPRTSNAQKSSAADDNRVSLFELMSHSNLWAELRLAQPDTPGSSTVDSSYASLSGELKDTMKQMVLHAIDSGALACDEVLLEVQCRQWAGVPQKWAEIRPSFTVDKVEGSLRDLVADGLVESVAIEAQTDVCDRKYRRVSPKTLALKTNGELRSTRFMKIAKPWKKQRTNMAHEWLE